MPRDRIEAPDEAGLGAVLEEIAAAALADDAGWAEVEDELEDGRRFGIAVALREGGLIAAGEARARFPIQSISKVFALTLALEGLGEALWKRVGREPSGDPFGSIIDLERHKGVPRNPFINAGALVTIDALLGLEDQAAAPHFVRAFLAEKLGVAPGDLPLDEEVIGSEHETGFGNRALANLAKSFGNLRHDVEAVMRVYVRQCAVRLSCEELARASRYLMRGRSDDAGGIGREAALRARRIAAVMLTCGMYDGAGEFAYRVGLPAKSGVAGAILAVVPEVATVAVWAPGLDASGNSLIGTRALERLSERMGWSVFGAVEPG